MLRWIVVIPIALYLLSACARHSNHFVGKWVAANANERADWTQCEFTDTTVACSGGNPYRGSGATTTTYDLRSETTADAKGIWIWRLQTDGNLIFSDGNGGNGGTIIMQRAN